LHFYNKVFFDLEDEYWYFFIEIKFCKRKNKKMLRKYRHSRIEPLNTNVEKPWLKRNRILLFGGVEDDEDEDVDICEQFQKEFYHKIASPRLLAKIKFLQKVKKTLTRFEKVKL